jgi:type I restriction enzyme S subunit
MIKKLKEVAKVNEISISSKSYPANIYYIDIASVDNGFITAAQEIKFSEAPTRARRIVKNKDILLSTVRPNLRHYAFVQNAKDNTIASTGFAVISCKNINPRFLYYFLTSNNVTDYLSAIAESHTSTYPSFPPEILEELEIPFPSEDEQEKIANILGTLDDKIELNRQMNQTLEAMARAIFKSWFVDFDPVYAKMEGRDYPLPPETMDLFPDEMEESELGLIPKGWRVGKVENNIEIQNGFAFKSEDYITDGVFVFRTKNFSTYNNCERLKDDVFLPNDFLQSHKKFICQPFDFHVVMVGASVGKTSIIYPNCLPALRNQNMWCFRPNKQFLYRHFINLLMKNLIQQKLTWASGSARDFFRKSDFYDFNVIYPEKRLLEKFENIINSMFQKISLNLSSTDILVSTREQLSPKLLKGEIDING